MSQKKPISLVLSHSRWTDSKTLTTQLETNLFYLLTNNTIIIIIYNDSDI